MFNLHAFLPYRAAASAVYGNRANFPSSFPNSHHVSTKIKTSYTSHWESAQGSGMIYCVSLYFTLCFYKILKHMQFSRIKISSFIPLVVCSRADPFGSSVPGYSWPLWDPLGVYSWPCFHWALFWHCVQSESKSQTGKHALQQSSQLWHQIGWSVLGQRRDGARSRPGLWYQHPTCFSLFWRDMWAPWRLKGWELSLRECCSVRLEFASFSLRDEIGD